MKRKATAEDLLAATLRKSQETDALRTDARTGMLAALEATKRSDVSPGKVEDADSLPAATNSGQTEGGVAVSAEEQRQPRARQKKSLQTLDPLMSLAGEDLHKTSVSFTHHHLQKLLDIEYHYRRKGIPGLGTNKLVMAIIGAIEIGPKLDAAVDAIVAQDRRTRRARGIKSDAAARDIKAEGADEEI
jgi:hypothetical protein